MRFNNNKLRTIIEHFGKLHQVIKLGEEVGELYKAILQFEDGYKRTNSDVTAEMADVYVLLEQLKIMYGVDEQELQALIDIKVDGTFEKYNITID